MCVFLGHCQFGVTMLGCWTVKTAWCNVSDWTRHCDTFNRFCDQFTAEMSPRVTAYNEHEVLITLTLILLNLCN